MLLNMLSFFFSHSDQVSNVPGLKGGQCQAKKANTSDILFCVSLSDE